MGGGKTTLVRGLVKGLSSADTVVSPTFTLKKNYSAKDTQIYHYDFYRLSDPGLMRDELAESIADPKTVIVIEWSDIVADVLPAERLTIELKPGSDDPDERGIIFNYSAGYENIIRQVETAWEELNP